MVLFKVPELGFWDVMVDFVLIDSFEDLSRPPSAVLAVTRNMFLSQSMKESTLTTVIWSMLKAKRARLSVRHFTRFKLEHIQFSVFEFVSY